MLFCYFPCHIYKIENLFCIFFCNGMYLGNSIIKKQEH